MALQAAAATGQGQLMALYERALASHGIAVAQILVTRSIWLTGGDTRTPPER